MRWNKKTAVLGEKKTLNCFAWIPTKLDYPEHEYVWLGWYKEDIVYREYGWDNSPYSWIIVKRYVGVEE